MKLPYSIDETYPTAKLEDAQNEKITEKNYGALKGLCEAVIHKYFPKNSLIIRPGLIVGPHDPTDRFTYWPIRINEGGEVLAPAHQAIQFIDVRDLAKWIVQMIEQQSTGIYNATGTPISFDRFLIRKGDCCTDDSEVFNRPFLTYEKDLDRS